jgi:hypothetical protein
MKRLKGILYTMIAFSSLLLWGCNEESVAVDYTDDNAYPPPVVTITSENTLATAEYRKNEIITGVVTSGNGLRDLYVTLLKNGENGYEEINKNYRVYLIFDGFPTSQEFSIEINIADKETAAIGVFGTDIYTKKAQESIVIQNLKGVPPMVTLIPQQIEAVELNGIVSLSGTASSKVGLQSIQYALARKSPYLELSTLKTIDVTPADKEKSFSFEITVDDERADAIVVIVTDADGYKETAFTDIVTITGIPEGRALIFENIEMAPEWENPINPSQPYIFSFEGLVVNGQFKNVVTLNDLVNSTSGRIDFAFVNFWRNSSFVPIANRGPGFASADRITGGTVGRQVDAPWLTNVGLNATFFKLIPPEMAAEMDLDNFFDNTHGNWETYQELDKLSTFVTGTGTADKQLLQRLNASSDRTGTPVLQIVDGTYIAIRRQFADNVKYGIIKVIKAVDDSGALNDEGKITGISSEPGKSNYYRGPDMEGFEYTGVTTLYGKKTMLKIIVQQ